MAVGEAVRALLPPHAKLVLDLCAAPGGKSTHLRSVLPNDCLLVANEIIRSRVGRLQENMERWGHAAHAVISLDPALIGERCVDLFDAIVIDAPCSGEGLFRKDDAAAEEWSLAHVAFCSARQQRILADTWPALRPGGLLIYSTCTLNTSEDEGAARFLQETLGAEPVALPDCIRGYGYPSSSFPEAIRILPNAAGAEGLFLAAFRKPGQAIEPLEQLHRRDMLRLPELKAGELAGCRKWLPEVGPDDLFLFKEAYRLLPQAVRSASLHLLRCVQVTSLGTAILEGGAKGTMLPLQGLATLGRFTVSAMPCELDLPTSLAFLRRDELREILVLEPGTYLATYQGLGLGWMKAIQGGRINNLLPHARRIRMDIPEGLAG